jgi:hypothetical protein
VETTAQSGATVPVSFDVTNTGSVAGAEVAELYVSDPSAKATRPERELKGFAKVRLAPGETKHVTLNLDARAFSYWDDAAHKWTIDPGKFVVRVGDSSENTPLNANLTLNYLSAAKRNRPAATSGRPVSFGRRPVLLRVGWTQLWRCACWLGNKPSGRLVTPACAFSRPFLPS